MRKTTFLDKLEQIEVIIKKCQVYYVSMVDQQGKPYVLPFNFGYKDGVVYLHSDNKGKKIDILKANPSVCISFSTDHDLFKVHDHVACSYGMAYRSVLVHGNVEFIKSNEEKIKALNVFMKQYADRDFTYSEPSVNNVCVYIVKIKEFTGKLYHHETLE